jgi:hypothetical protein
VFQPAKYFPFRFLFFFSAKSNKLSVVTRFVVYLTFWALFFVEISLKVEKTPVGIL